MHIFPKEIAYDIELIFEYKKNIFRSIFRKQKSLEEIDKEINKLLMDFCEKMGEEYYWLHILFIFKH